jgi:Fe-S cluster assembly ATP-binding protein
MDSAVKQLQMRKDLPHRYLNDGFSGGEKKRNEILQMLILQPRLAILDEIDSGLDMDALKVVGNAIADQVQKGTAMLIITHYERILEYVKPDFVHIMADGKIVKTGGVELIEQIQQKGYDAVVGEL